MNEATIRDLSFVHHFESDQEGESLTSFWHVHPTGDFEQDRAAGAKHAPKSSRSTLQQATIIAFTFGPLSRMYSPRRVAIFRAVFLRPSGISFLPAQSTCHSCRAMTQE